MKYISRNMVIGLILLSSLPAFSQESTEKSAILNIQENPERANNTPDGGAGYVPADVMANTVTRWIEKLNSSSSCPVQVKDIVDKINQDAAKYKQTQKNCQDREDKANRVCMESRSSDIKNALMMAQILTGSLSGMADACNKFGQVMDAVNKSLTAYQTACSSLRGYCMSACGAAVGALKSIEKNKTELINKVTTEANRIASTSKEPSTVTACNTLASSFGPYVNNNSKEIKDELKVEDGEEAYKAVAKKEETCKSYAKELASAGVGMLGVMKSFGTANKCEQQTTNAATQTPVDCTIPENKQNNMTCICKDAPRTPGCNSGLDSALTAKNADSLRAASSSDNIPASGSSNKLDGIDGAGTTDLASKSGDSGSSLPGAPSGGGNAGLDGGGGMGGGAGGAEAKKASGLNANILGGEGGGGGGGSWGGYGGGGDPSLRQYLPGGAKDPAIGMAGAAVSKEVTSQGGKSNWEKVKERYRDNKPSLLGY